MAAHHRRLQSEVAGAAADIGMHAHRRGLHGLRQGGIAGLEQHVEHGVVADGGDEQAGHHDPLAADAVGQPAEQHEGRRADDEADQNQRVHAGLVQLHRLLQEDHDVELAGEIGRALAGGDADQRQQHQAQAGPLAEGLLDRILRQAVLLLHAREHGRLVQPGAHIDGNRQHHDRQDERQAPAPLAEVLCAHRGLGAQDHDQRQDQPGRRGDLDPAGQQAAAPRLAMLGHIDHRAAVFAAHGQALHHAQGQQQYPRQVARRFIGGQAADQHGRPAHHHHRDQEGVLAPEPVAEIAKQHRAQRPDDEAHRQRAQRRQQRHGRIVLRKQHLAHEDGQGSIDEKVVPLEQGAEGRCHHDLAFLFAAERLRATRMLHCNIRVHACFPDHLD